MIDASRRFVLARRPEGTPELDAFELETVEIPAPRHGEVVVRTLYLSVDPYMRDRMREGESYSEPWGVGDPLRGGAVAEVVASEHDRWSAGDRVVGNLYWGEHARVDGDRLNPVDASHPNVTLSSHLGVLGMPGRTAYFGTLEVADPDPGETLVVTGAAGAVGSTVCQIGRLAGARVVGFAGSDRKVEYLEDELGVDAGINYERTEDYRAALDDAAPDGVDAYFDNVGGPITDAVFTRLNLDARVAVCGQIALYNREETPTGPRKLPGLISTRATVQGLLVRDFGPRFRQASERLRGWVEAGELTYRESVVDGLENAPEAFLGLFEGENIGKQVVRVAEPTEST